jgi:excisionase family DNA binding protein
MTFCGAWAVRFPRSREFFASPVAGRALKARESSAMDGREYELKRQMVVKGLMRPKEVAQFLGKSQSTIYEMITTGELPYVLVRGTRRIPRKVVEDYAIENLVIQ